MYGLFTFTDPDTDSDPIQLELVSESNFVQYEKFYIVQCSYLVSSPNRYPNPNPSGNHYSDRT